jgi:hypothetical protein
MNPILRAVFALLLFFVVVPALARADAVPATISYLEGDVTIIDPAGNREKAVEEMHLAPGTTVKTGADGNVGLRLTPGATTVVGPNTTMKIQALNYSKTADGKKKRDILLDLKQGALYNSLVKKDGQSDFQISTPEGVAAARGTDWSVTVGSNGGVTVAVVDGVVEITLPNGGGVIKVKAGQAAVSTTGNPVSYTITGLTAEQRHEIIYKITHDGFSLSEDVNGNPTYSLPQTLNPANVSGTPTQSGNQ